MLDIIRREHELLQVIHLPVIIALLIKYLVSDSTNDDSNDED